MVEAWLARLAVGDYQGAWDLFINRYRRLIIATIRRLITDDDDVMDVFASTCQALVADDFARLKRYSETKGATVSTWLVIVVRNQTIDWLRKRDGRRPKDGGNEPRAWQKPPKVVEPITSERDPAEALESSERLEALLADQPADLRLAILLFVVEKMPAAQVAQTVGWPDAKSVYNRVPRALAVLRAELERQGIGPGDL